MLLWIGLFLASCLGMEAVAYLVHKYVMHGPLWAIHRSHHAPKHEGLELNDLFGLGFASASTLLIYLGCHGHPLLLPLGAGSAVYGVFNWAFHDVLVHRRIRHSWLVRGRYLRRLVRAHHIHHRTRGQHGAEAFGFFYARDYLREARRPAGGTR